MEMFGLFMFCNFMAFNLTATQPTRTSTEGKKIRQNSKNAKVSKVSSVEKVSEHTLTEEEERTKKICEILLTKANAEKKNKDSIFNKKNKKNVTWTDFDVDGVLSKISGHNQLYGYPIEKVFAELMEDDKMVKKFRKFLKLNEVENPLLGGAYLDFFLTFRHLNIEEFDKLEFALEDEFDHLTELRKLNAYYSLEDTLKFCVERIKLQHLAFTKRPAEKSKFVKFLRKFK